MDIGVKDGKIVGVRGRAVDRVNKGRLGPKDYMGRYQSLQSQRVFVDSNLDGCPTTTRIALDSL